MISKKQTVLAACAVAAVISGGLYYQVNSETGEPVVVEVLEVTVTLPIETGTAPIPTDTAVLLTEGKLDVQTEAINPEHAPDNVPVPDNGG